MKRKTVSEKDVFTQSRGTSPEMVRKRLKPLDQLPSKISMEVYGRSGTGKTTFAATMIDVMPPEKKVVLIDVKEEGQDSIADLGNRIDLFSVKKWDDIVGIYWYLKESEHPYGGFIIDTVTQMQNLAMRWARKKSDSPDVMSRRAWGVLGAALGPLLLDFRDLPMHSCFIAQDRRSGGLDTDEEIDDLIPDFGPALIPSVAKDLNAMVKNIGQTYIRRREVKQKGKYMKKIEFRMRVGPHPVFLTKVRTPRSYKVPASIVDPTFTKIHNIMKGKEV